MGTFGIILSSTVLATLISSYFAKMISDKANKLKHITKERKQWRDDIRKATVEVRKIGDENQKDKMFKSIQEARTYFEIRLNPDDPEDNKLLECLNTKRNCITKSFDKYVARLLKHDWERAKQETKGNFIKNYCLILGFIAIGFWWFPVTDWLGLLASSNSASMADYKNILNDIIRFETFLFFIILPLLFFAIDWCLTFVLGYCEVVTKYESGKIAICSFFKIPYRVRVKVRKTRKINKILKY